MRMKLVLGRILNTLIVGLLATRLCAQAEQNPTPDTPPPQQRWNLFYQATSVASTHGVFRSPYSGPFSLQSRREADVSLTSTLFFGLRLARYTQLYIDPEIAGGRGFSGVNGLANQYNGELPRVGSATPTPYLARGFITQDFKLGEEMENFTSDENQLAGSRPVKRYTVTIGR